MNWWPRRRRPGNDDMEQDLRDAREARAGSEEALADARADWGEVRELSGVLRRAREANHFAAMVQQALRGGQA